jgi:hypothetical protein
MSDDGAERLLENVGRVVLVQPALPTPVRDKRAVKLDELAPGGFVVRLGAADEAGRGGIQGVNCHVGLAEVESDRRFVQQESGYRLTQLIGTVEQRRYSDRIDV